MHREAESRVASLSLPYTKLDNFAPELRVAEVRMQNVFCETRTVRRSWNSDYDRAIYRHPNRRKLLRCTLCNMFTHHPPRFAPSQVATTVLLWGKVSFSRGTRRSFHRRDLTPRGSCFIATLFTLDGGQLDFLRETGIQMKLAKFSQ
jgi:hypothetical protein